LVASSKSFLTNFHAAGAHLLAILKGNNHKLSNLSSYSLPNENSHCHHQVLKSLNFLPMPCSHLMGKPLLVLRQTIHYMKAVFFSILAPANVLAVSK
jgi:hypothetical protein